MSETIAHPFSTATGTDVRVRFCPSPTGTPHVGLIRTAMFNWAYARHTGGKMIFRIEDTDAARDTEESFDQIVEGMRWLHLDWDEGVEVGGPHGPYRQSERYDIYRDVIARLVESGHIYESFATGVEIEARNMSLGRDPKLGYDNYERDLTDEQKAAYRAEGRSPALRLRVPDTELSFDDLVRGKITFPVGSFSDFVVVRPNGHPLYPFVNPVDDALMGVTHVLRGEDLLSSTPRQIALYHALIDIGLTTFVPRFGHLPFVLGDKNKKMSKREPESNLFHHRDRGFIPEGLLNYLALLGWSISHDRDVFSIEELVAAFDVVNVNPNPARFDQKKAEAINGDHIRLLAAEDFAARIVPYLTAANVLSEPLSDDDRAILVQAAPLIQERIALLGEAPAMLGFLFVTADTLVIEADALKSLPQAAGEILAASGAALRAVPEEEWATDRVHTALNEVLLEGLALKPRVAFGPLRVAVSGRKVSPPLFESMEILGQVETLDRLDRLANHLAAVVPSA
ncbi:glutamate--tRNA ligase [Cryobacterium psychrophilum]|uniref:Glutamate--tRNA ligase n=1 Tax=Cryobacterium psychrophilum TaxID=41988 RepID=A0A4Y8KLW8_9MICO|nr:glutamate--tRNA ligase [Cryobacterium psychrophilum]TDW31156.1 glutamyl-tRNA synthetase [Cryobacterium psychrophilum]TFD78549.1 glutamate--tRNA ligase [Cryobacterium psychrophilum]